MVERYRNIMYASRQLLYTPVGDMPGRHSISYRRKLLPFTFTTSFNRSPSTIQDSQIKISTMVQKREREKKNTSLKSIYSMMSLFCSLNLSNQLRRQIRSLRRESGREGNCVTRKRCYESLQTNESYESVETFSK